MFFVGLFPCDPQCIDVSQTGKLHSLTSTVPAILIPIAVMLSAYPVLRFWGTKWGYLSFIIGALSIVTGPIMFIEYLNNYTGLIQRLGIGLSLFWILIVSIKIMYSIGCLKK
ncbi:MAG: DUF998 domain-containing protein [Promethearchaeota archaeon]